MPLLRAELELGSALSCLTSHTERSGGWRQEGLYTAVQEAPGLGPVG